MNDSDKLQGHRDHTSMKLFYKGCNTMVAYSSMVLLALTMSAPHYIAGRKFNLKDR